MEDSMRKIGPVMLDVAAAELTEQDRHLISSELCGGLILFSRNFESAEQILALTNEIRRYNPDIIIAVDQEGGRVQRFVEGFSKLPPLKSLGDYFLKEPQKALKVAGELGELMALEVQSVGCDISFAPVLDLGYLTSRIIGDRAFAVDPKVIVHVAKAYIDGMKKGGMAATGKHFPGHGSVEADSHVDIPYDDRAFAEIEQQDLKPFVELKDDLEALMFAHIIYSQVDELPAGFSPVWLQQVLRQDIGYDGVIFSDDLSMKGAEVIGDFEQRATHALSAGCDMVLVCNDREATLAVMESLKEFKISKDSDRRLRRMKMKSTPIGLRQLKQSERWQYLSSVLEEFNKARG